MICGTQICFPCRKTPWANSLRSRLPMKERDSLTKDFFARRDGWSRPYSYGLRKRILIISRKKSIRPNYSEHNRN